MQLSFDPVADVAYLRFRETEGQVETIRLTDDFLVDIDETGAVCGVELLNAREQLAAADDGKLVVLDALGVRRGELAVA
jgi:uncharacterized protein YuzE